MEQFSIERWKELGGGHECVRTRDGRKVDEIHYFKSIQHNGPIVAVVEGACYFVETNGRYLLGMEDVRDLMLVVPEEVTKMYYGVHEVGLTAGAPIKKDTMPSTAHSIDRFGKQMGFLVVERNMTTGKAKAWIEDELIPEN